MVSFSKRESRLLLGLADKAGKLVVVLVVVIMLVTVEVVGVVVLDRGRINYKW